ncbi:RNA binding protein, putative, partial [Ichthyophthirius multifiliis]
NPLMDENLTAKQKREQDQRTIYISNLNISAQKQEIIDQFKQIGKIENIWIQEKKNYKKLNVHIQYFLKKKKLKHHYNMMELFFRIMFQGQIELQNKQQNDYSRTALIQKFNEEAKEEDFREFFEDCGIILQIKILKNTNNFVGDGMAYLFFKEKKGLENALLKNGKNFLGKKIRIQRAEEEFQTQKQGEINNKGDDKIIKKKKKRNHDIIPLKKFNSLAKINFNQNENDIFEFKNELAIAPRIIRKKIKKLKRKGFSENQQFVKIQKLKKSKKESNDRNIFNNKFSLQARKEKREKRSILNKKK